VHGGAYGLLRAGVSTYEFGPVAILPTALLTVRRAPHLTSEDS
jgi:hypothetical protein